MHADYWTQGMGIKKDKEDLYQNEKEKEGEKGIDTTAITRNNDDDYLIESDSSFFSEINSEESLDS